MYGNQYYNGYNFQPQFQQQNNSQMQQFQQSAQQVQQPILNGKYVQNVDCIMANDVPMGVYSIFPKSDMSEIYVKFWDGNGTIQTMTFKETGKEEVIEQPTFQEQLLTMKNEIMERFDKLEKPARTTRKKEVEE